jgi:hypothetical protein
MIKTFQGAASGVPQARPRVRYLTVGRPTGVLLDRKDIASALTAAAGLYGKIKGI